MVPLEVITDVSTGEVVVVYGDPILPTIEDYRLAIDAHVEATARSKSYNSAAHIASYVASTVPQWRDEASVFVAWRDQVWLTAYGLMASLQEPITIEQALASLPEIKWPEA